MISWISLAVVGSFGATSWNGRIYEAESATEWSRPQLLQALSGAKNIVIGEKHYTQSIQEEEGRLIREVVGQGSFQNRFTTAWEFLNFSQQSVTTELFSQVIAGTRTVFEFLTLTQGSPNATVYSPLIESTAQLGGHLLGVNLSREEKAPVVRSGLSALDPTLLPPDFALGSEAYFERFRAAMEDGGHSTHEQILRYFDAQCLTDDVMAYRLIHESTDLIRFLIAGSFHSDYLQGAPARIRIRSPDDLTLVVSLIDSSDYSESELLGLLTSPVYGKLADFVIFLGEPNSP